MTGFGYCLRSSSWVYERIKVGRYLKQISQECCGEPKCALSRCLINAFISVVGPLVANLSDVMDRVSERLGNQAVFYQHANRAYKIALLNSEMCRGRLQCSPELNGCSIRNTGPKHFDRVRIVILHIVRQPVDLQRAPFFGFSADKDRLSNYLHGLEDDRPGASRTADDGVVAILAVAVVSNCVQVDSQLIEVAVAKAAPRAVSEAHGVSEAHLRPSRTVDPGIRA
jgi:hypothetical protein